MNIVCTSVVELQTIILKKEGMKGTRLIVSMVIFFVLLFSCSRYDVRDTRIKGLNFKESKYLTAILEVNTPGYFLKGGQPTGYHYEMLKAYARKRGLYLKIVPFTSRESAVHLLKSGKADIIAVENSSISDESGLRKTVPHWKLHYSILSFSSVNLSNSDAIYIPSSLLTKEEVSSLKNKYRNVVTFNSLNTGLLVDHLQMKSRSCAIVQSSVAEAISLKHPEVKIQKMDDLGANSWYVSSKNSFLLDLNSWLADTRNSIAHSSYYSSFYQNYKVNRALAGGVNLAGDFFLSEYDEIVKNFSTKIGWDWLLISSLIYQESQFKPSVVSSRGAKGLMQVMPETANQFGYQSVHSSSTNVYIGTRLIARLAKIFSKYPIGIEEQKKFVLAAYNGGIGRVLDAMRTTAKYGRDPYNWDDVSIFFLRKNPSLVNPNKVRNENETTRFVKEVLERYYNYKALSLS